MPENQLSSSKRVLNKRWFFTLIRDIITIGLLVMFPGVLRITYQFLVC